MKAWTAEAPGAWIKKRGDGESYFRADVRDLRDVCVASPSSFSPGGARSVATPPPIISYRVPSSVQVQRLLTD